MLAAVFVRSGFDAMMNPDRLVDRAKPVSDALAPTLDAFGLPTDARTLVQANGAAQLAGGLLLASGTAPRTGALVLAGSMVPTTFAGHPFWQEDDPGQRARQPGCDRVSKQLVDVGVLDFCDLDALVLDIADERARATVPPGNVRT